MRKLFVMMAMLAMNFVLAMDSPSLLSGLQLNSNDTWSPQVILQNCNPFHVKFSPSGKKIMVISRLNTTSQISIWGVEDCKKSFSYNTNFVTSNIALTKDEKKLFVIGDKGHRLCFDLIGNDLLWKKRGSRVKDGQFKFCHDESKMLISSWQTAVLVSALTGKQEAVLWHQKLKDTILQDTVVGDFYQDSSRGIVFHNGLLDDKNNDVRVEYKKLVPQGVWHTFYNREQNELIYFTAQTCIILNMVTQHTKEFAILPRRSSSVHLIDDGKKLLRTSYSVEDPCFVDIYDLETAHLMTTIPCSFQPKIINFCSKKNILLLALRGKLQLWDILAASLVLELKHKTELIESASMNDEGDKIVVAQESGKVLMWQKK